jgi:transposase
VAEAVGLLDPIPGVGEQVAQTIVAEIGVERARFPSAEHLASWARLCPGNHKSAGKRQSGKTTQGSPCLRAALVQAAGAASHRRGTSRAAQSQRLVKRMGKKKALVAVARSMLVSGSHMLSRRTRSGSFVNWKPLGSGSQSKAVRRRPGPRLIRFHSRCLHSLIAEGL